MPHQADRVVKTELVHEPVAVAGRRLETHAKAVSDFLGAVSIGDLDQNLGFPRRQALDIASAICLDGCGGYGSRERERWRRLATAFQCASATPACTGKMKRTSSVSSLAGAE